MKSWNSHLLQIFNLFPVIKHFPGPHQKVWQNANSLNEFIREAVEDHRKSLDPEHPRDFIDAYLVELTKVRAQIAEETAASERLL